jgi:sulfite exporter TauE/SafE
MTAVDFTLAFSLGLLSSLHCVQMCGPLVVAYSIPMAKHPALRQSLSHLAYNGGRIATYTILGATGGFLGSTLGVVGHLAGVEGFVAIFAGVLMTLAGLAMLDMIPLGRLRAADPLGITSKLLRPLAGRLSSESVRDKFTLGLLLGFLPCGLVYAALLKAVSTGTPVAGALTMFAFGTGTAVSLLALGLFALAFRLRSWRWGSWPAAVSVVVVGLILVWRGVMPIMATQDGHPPTACPQCANESGELE